MNIIEKLKILNSLEDLIYITRKEDNSLVFISDNLKSHLNIDDKAIGKKCYDIFKIGDTQCDFCKKGFPKECFSMKKSFSISDNRFYLNRGKEIEIDGVAYNLVVVDDITEQEKNNIELDRRREAQKINYRFLTSLTSQTESLDEAVNDLLRDVAEYYNADRAYVFLIDYDKETLSNIYEYSAKGVIPQIDNLQNLPLDVIDRWIILFETEGKIFIDSVESELDVDSLEYKILAEQNIKRLQALPFFMDGNVVGFIGIDDPKYDYRDFTLLSTVSFYIFYDISKRLMYQKLQILSVYDTLTGLKNRNSYIEVVDKFDKMKLRSIGVIFIDLNGLKEANDEFGHEYGDRLLKNASSVIKQVFDDNAYRIGGDEFVVLIKNPNQEEFNKLVNKFDSLVRSNDKINISYGSIYQRNPKDIEMIVSKADQLMYENKKNYYVNKK